MNTARPFSSVVCVSTTVPFCFNSKIAPFRYFLLPSWFNCESTFSTVTSLLVPSNPAFLTILLFVGLKAKSAVLTNFVPAISSVALFPFCLSFDLVNTSSSLNLVNLTK